MRKVRLVKIRMQEIRKWSNDSHKKEIKENDGDYEIGKLIEKNELTINKLIYK